MTADLDIQVRVRLLLLLLLLSLLVLVLIGPSAVRMTPLTYRPQLVRDGEVRFRYQVDAEPRFDGIISSASRTTNSRNSHSRACRAEIFRGRGAEAVPQQHGRLRGVPGERDGRLPRLQVAVLQGLLPLGGRRPGLDRGTAAVVSWSCHPFLLMRRR